LVRYYPSPGLLDRVLGPWVKDDDDTAKVWQGAQSSRPWRLLTKTAATFYSIGLFLPAFSWLLKWLYASHHEGIIDPHLDPKFVRKLTRLYGTTVILQTRTLRFGWADTILSVALLPTLAPIYLPEEQLQCDEASRPACCSLAGASACSCP
jgi:hypothetical protein